MDRHKAPLTRRFVVYYCSAVYSHDDIRIHAKLAQAADAPIAALIEDLKSRGLFDDTLLIIGSEFGRTPMIQNSGLEKVGNGRDHNVHGYCTLLAGGGVKGGVTYGATDDFGYKAVEKPCHVHDLHATALHLLGIHHKGLTIIIADAISN